MKKIISVFTALAMFLTLFLSNMTVLGADGDFEISSDGLVSEYYGTDTEVVIPSEIDGITVVGIKKSAFRGNDEIVSVILPDTVRTIGASAFLDCTSLERINLGNVTAIGEGAFRYCIALADIGYLNEELEGLYSGTFSACDSLVSITVKGMNTDIEGALPSNDDLVLRGYTGSLAEKYAHLAKIPFYDLDTGERVIKDWVVDDEGRLVFYNGADKEITIPDTVDDIQVVSIAKTAFAGNKTIESVIISEGIAEMEDSAFYGCTGLRTVTLPSTLTALPLEAFAVCTALETINIPSTVIEFDANIFMDCSNVTIYGEAGSEAEKYAAELDIPFVSTGVYDDTVYNVKLSLAKNIIFPDGGITVTVYSGIYHRLAGGMPSWWVHSDLSFPSYILEWETPEATVWHKYYASVSMTESRDFTLTDINQTINVSLKNPDHTLGCVGYILKDDNFIGSGGKIIGKTKTAAALEMTCYPKAVISGTVTIPESDDDTHITIFAEGNKIITRDEYGFYNSGNEFAEKTMVTIEPGETTASYSLDVRAGMDFTVTAMVEGGKYRTQVKEIKEIEQGVTTLDFNSFSVPDNLNVTVQLPENVKELKMTSGEVVSELTGTVYIQNADEPYELIDSADFKIQNGENSVSGVMLRNITGKSDVIVSYVLWSSGNGELCGLYDEGSYFKNGKCVKEAGKAARLQINNQFITLTLAASFPLDVSIYKENNNVLSITSKTDMDKITDIYIAYYDKKGQLISVESDSVNISAGSAVSKALTLNENTYSAAEAVRVCLWDGIEPLCEAIKLK